MITDVDATNNMEREFYVVAGDINILVKAKSQEEAIEIAQLHMEYFGTEQNRDLVADIYEKDSVN